MEQSALVTGMKFVLLYHKALCLEELLRLSFMLICLYIWLH